MDTHKYSVGDKATHPTFGPCIIEWPQTVEIEADEQLVWLCAQGGVQVVKTADLSPR